MHIKLSKKYIITATSLLIFLVVISRASYLSIYVEILLLFSFCYFYKPETNKKTFDIWVVYGLIYIFIGMVNTNDPQMILNDAIHILPFAALVFTSPQFRRDYFSNQYKGIKRLLPFGVILYILIFEYMQYNWLGSEKGRFTRDESIHLVLDAPLKPLMFIPPLLCIQNLKTTKVENICLILGTIAFMHLGYITSTKSWFLGVTYILMLRLAINRGGKSQLKYLVFVIILGISLYYIVNEYMLNLSDNFIDKFDVDNASNTSRWDEGMGYLRQCNGWQLLFGKGFGGMKIFYAGQSHIGGEYMLHMGWCYLILKGGIFLMCIIYFPLLYIIVKDYQQHNYEYVLLALYILFTDQMHTTFTSINIIYWALIYLRFYHRSTLPNYTKTSDNR